jgi:hypothetical protein
LEADDTINEGITINYVDADNSWTLVQKCKKKRTKQDGQEKRWNAQQRQNFLRFGDIYRSESYKNYRNVDVGPRVANISLQQPVAQPPVVVQGIPPPPVVLPQCNLRLSLQELLHFHSLSLRLRRYQLHKVAKNVPGSRPFWKKKKKKKKKNRSRKEQAIAVPHPPPLHQTQTTLSLPKILTQHPTPQPSNQKALEVPLEPEATTFSQSFDVWPLHRMQILPDGSTR